VTNDSRSQPIISSSLILALVLSLRAAAAAAVEIEVDSVLITAVDQVQVPVKEAGIIERLDVREGQLVEVGQVLGSLDVELELLEQERATLELKSAELVAENDVELRLALKGQEFARKEVSRARETVAAYPKSITQMEVDRLQLAAEKAELEAEKAAFEIKVAKLNQSLKRSQLSVTATKLRRRTITAPVRGIVVQLFHRPGERVAAEAPVVRIVGLDRLRAEGFLHIGKIGADVEGSEVRLRVAISNEKKQEIACKITFVSPEIEPVDGRFRIWAELSNREGQFRPGMPASMTVVTSPKPPMKVAKP
jgi:multidrug efflux pump subunit AcrA (membrane-fusion protein)